MDDGQLIITCLSLQADKAPSTPAVSIFLRIVESEKACISNSFHPMI